MVLSQEDKKHLNEDFHQSSIGRYTIDVGWYPQNDPSGEFRCVVVVDSDWEKPLQLLRTRDREKMANWVLKQMKIAVTLSTS